jgi:hypothetical protein
MSKKEIKTSYLMWVGAESYPTIKDWTDEAITLGISKRLPTPAAGKKLMEPGAVVFVAHDEGEYDGCMECHGVTACPECRKQEHAIVGLEAEIAKFKSHFKGDEDFEVFASKGQKRSVAVREAKIKKIAAEMEICGLCVGKGNLEGGTGGHVVLKDGTKLDYRAFNYWLHQPKKFNVEDVKERAMCSTCGGTGKLPRSKVFGMFLPENIEYILKDGEDAAKLEAVKDFKHVEMVVVAKEAKRGCGKRHAGGVYAVTSPDASSKKAKKALQELIDAGVIKPAATEIHGNFVRFLEPIEVPIKRFRGIKTWGLDPAVESAAEDVLEAMS